MRRLLFAGCYTHHSPIGVRAYVADGPDGRLIEAATTEGIEHASFLAAHPGGRVLYAVSETSRFDGGTGGGVLAFAIDPSDGSLTEIGRTASHGDAPCHVSVDDDGRRLHVANYGSGTVASYALDVGGRIGRTLGVRQHVGSGPTDRQTGPHAHAVVPGPDRRSIYAVDLGTDRIVQTVDGDVVDELRLAPGTGPRHLTFHPTAPVAYIVGELSSTLVTARVDAVTGRLADPVACSSLPDGYRGDSLGAEVCMHPGGRHLYVSNRGHDSVAQFDVAHPEAPRFVTTVPSGGEHPRHITVHPDGRALLVANQHSDAIVVLGIDPDGGALSPTGTIVAASQPACLTYVEVPT